MGLICADFASVPVMWNVILCIFVGRVDTLAHTALAHTYIAMREAHLKSD